MNYEEAWFEMKDAIAERHVESVNRLLEEIGISLEEEEEEEEERFSALRGSIETMGDILNWMYYKETSQGEG